MPLLTQGEYDDLPDQCKIDLAVVVWQPQKDKKSDHFRRRWGRFMNGEVDADPRPRTRIGFGTGSPLAPPFPRTGRPTTPNYGVAPTPSLAHKPDTEYEPIEEG